jgi:hypothetical protein
LEPSKRADELMRFLCLCKNLHIYSSWDACLTNTRERLKIMRVRPMHTSSDAINDDDAKEAAVAEPDEAPPPRKLCTRVLMHMTASDRMFGCHRRTVRSELAVTISELSRLRRGRESRVAGGES